MLEQNKSMNIQAPPQISADAFNDFLEDLRVTCVGNINSAFKDSDARGVFNTTYSASSILKECANNDTSALPLLHAASGICRRCATLLVLKQISLVRVELRRFIECIFLYIYFLDHPLEWQVFCLDPSKSRTFDKDSPLSTTANALPSTYRAYAKELIETAERQNVRGKPQKIKWKNEGSKALGNLSNLYSNLSKEVHAGMGSVHPSGSLALTQDHYTKKIAAKIREELHLTLSSGVYSVIAANPKLLSSLGSSSRKSFDQLIGNDLKKTLSDQTFGVQRTWTIKKT